MGLAIVRTGLFSMLLNVWKFVVTDGKFQMNVMMVIRTVEMDAVLPVKYRKTINALEDQAQTLQNASIPSST